MGTLKRADKKTLERELDEAAILWKTSLSENDRGKALDYREKIWLLVFRLYDRDDLDERDCDPSALLKVLEEAFEKYDPREGQFSHYFSKLFSGRKKDFSDYNSRHAPVGDSLDLPVSEDGNLTLGDMLAADETSQPEGTMDIDGRLAELTAAIMVFLHKKDREHNDARKMWFRIFYTEDMTLAMKELALRFLHEREVFSAMDVEYLDYYMAAPCRTGKEVMGTPLRPYCEVVPARRDTDPVPLPIPGDVSLCFLKACRGISAGGTARSNQIGFYTQLKKTLSP